jgi:hypothetical protein
MQAKPIDQRNINKQIKAMLVLTKALCTILVASIICAVSALLALGGMGTSTNAARLSKLYLPGRSKNE